MSKTIVSASATGLPTRRLFIGAGSAAAVFGALHAAAAAETHPDAELLKLGYQLKQAWAEENIGFDALPDDYTYAAANALLEPCSQICDQIMAIKANTIEGLRVKAMAVNWCWSGEYDPDDQGTTSERLEQSVIRDLLAI